MSRKSLNGAKMTLRGRILAVRAASIALTIGLATTGAVALAGPGQAAGFDRGPAPTVASISATTGPYAVATKTIQGSFNFSKATIYYPTSTAEGTYGVIAIVPGFVSLWSQMAWLGPRLASQGFVVIGIDTTTIFDFPSVRADEFKAAIAAAKRDATVAAVGDFSRVAIAGWSMGGGGALDAAAAGDYKAVIPIAPWEVVNPSAKVTEPTLMIAGQGDPVAPAATMSQPFYDGVNSSKAYLEITNGSHFFPASPNTAMAAAMISWLKIYVDGDARYTQFVCPQLAVATGVSSYKSAC